MFAEGVRLRLIGAATMARRLLTFEEPKIRFDGGGKADGIIEPTQSDTPRGPGRYRSSPPLS